MAKAVKKAAKKAPTLGDRVERTLQRLGDEATTDAIAQRISVKAPKVSAALVALKKASRVTSRDKNGETFFRTPKTR